MVSTNLLRNELKKSLQLKINFIICEMGRIPTRMNDTYFVGKFLFTGCLSPSPINKKSKKKRSRRDFSTGTNSYRDIRMNFFLALD